MLESLSCFCPIENELDGSFTELKEENFSTEMFRKNLEIFKQSVRIQKMIVRYMAMQIFVHQYKY